MMRRISRLLLRCCLLLAAVGLAGCAYTTASTWPADVNTIDVPIFQNHTFYRGVERDVTEALTKQIEARTPFKVAAAGRSDSQLLGTVVSVDQRQTLRRPGVGYPREMELVIRVDWVWTDNRTGVVLRERQGFEAIGRYIPEGGVDQRLETAQQQAAGRLADAIVDTMRADF